MIENKEQSHEPRKILLLTATEPGTSGVGSIILRDLICLLPNNMTHVCVVGRGQGLSDTSRQLYLQDCAWRIQGGRIKRILRLPFQKLKNRKIVETSLRTASRWAKNLEIDLIWLVLDAPANILIGQKLAGLLGVPYVVMVWDDVQHNLPYFGVHRLSVRGLRREFGKTLQHASRCAVIGESMKAHYEETYGVDSIILRHGIDRELIHNPITDLPGRGPLRIGFVGSVTAASAFRSFVRALDEQAWTIAGRPVELRLAGHRFDLSCQNPARIEYLGWRSVEETIAMLSECEVNYLPQPFEPGLHALAQLSFPTKLTTYLAAARPILLHCPKAASLWQFHQKYAFGMWCGSLERDDLVASLEHLVTDADLYSESCSAGRKALESEFTEKTFREAFERFIGCSLESTRQIQGQDQSRVEAALN